MLLGAVSSGLVVVVGELWWLSCSGCSGIRVLLLLVWFFFGVSVVGLFVSGWCGLLHFLLLLLFLAFLCLLLPVLLLLLLVLLVRLYLLLPSPPSLPLVLCRTGYAGFFVPAVLGFDAFLHVGVA